jgi:hypothetical protein
MKGTSTDLYEGEKNGAGKSGYPSTECSLIVYVWSTEHCRKEHRPVFAYHQRQEEYKGPLFDNKALLDKEKFMYTKFIKMTNVTVI